MAEVTAYGTAQDGGISMVRVHTNLGNKGQCGSDFSTGKLQTPVTPTAKKYITKLDQKVDSIAIKEELVLKN